MCDHAAVGRLFYLFVSITITITQSNLLNPPLMLTKFECIIYHVDDWSTPICKVSFYAKSPKEARTMAEELCKEGETFEISETTIKKRINEC
jgi:hypothetical protein